MNGFNEGDYQSFIDGELYMVVSQVTDGIGIDITYRIEDSCHPQFLNALRSGEPYWHPSSSTMDELKVRGLNSEKISFYTPTEFLLFNESQL